MNQKQLKNARRCPLLFDGPIADYVSDGTIGLLSFIRVARVYSPGKMMLLVGQSIRRAIWAETRSRTWAGRKRVEATRTIQRIRADLTTEHGCTPTREAIITALAEKVKNPNVYFCYIDEGIKEMVPRSQLEKDDGRKLMKNEDPRAKDPSSKVMDEEVVRLAMKGLDKIDRKILRMALAGEGDVAIGKAVGLSRSSVYVRRNGVLWEARCRAVLAAHLGVEPDEAPVRSPYGGLVSINSVPPARLVG